MSKSLVQKIALASLVFLGLIIFSLPAFADSATFTFANPNNGLSSIPGPYGQVSLVLVGNTIQVTVTMFGNFGIAGGGPAFGLNGPNALSAGNFTFGTPGFSCCNPGGYGNFQYVIRGPAPAGNPPHSLSFTISPPSGFNGGRGFTSVSQAGNNFMAHVITPSGVTGYTTVDDGDLSSLALFVVGLPALLVLWHTRRSTKMS